MRVILIIYFLIAAVAWADGEPMRIWTSMSGAKVEAAFVRDTGDFVVLKTTNDEIKIRRSSLSPQDREYLTDQAAKAVELRKRELSLTNIKKIYDPMEGFTFYKNGRECSLDLGDGETVTLFMYLAQAENILRLKFKLIYSARDWLFIDKLTLLSDSGHRAVVDLSSKRDGKVVSGEGIIEWSDVILTPDDFLKFNAANTITCRLTGQFRRDFALSTDQLMSIREILEMYINLAGNSTEP